MKKFKNTIKNNGVFVKAISGNGLSGAVFLGPHRIGLKKEVSRDLLTLR